MCSRSIYEKLINSVNIYILNACTSPECNNGQFGQDCKENCACNASNTQRCDHVNGKCICQHGWDGEICSQDTDECKGNKYNCPKNSRCENSIGSYTCKCKSGFHEGYNKSCIGNCLCLFIN